MLAFPTNPASLEGSSVSTLSTQPASPPDENYLTFKQVLETLASPPTPSPFEMGDWVITPEGHTGIVTGKTLCLLLDKPIWEFAVTYLEFFEGEDEGVWDEMSYLAHEIKAASPEQITEMSPTNPEPPVSAIIAPQATEMMDEPF